MRAEKEKGPFRMFNVGFSGTRRGLTGQQLTTLRTVFNCLTSKRSDIVLHHGDCVGADYESHMLALEMSINTVIHPPTSNRFRAFCIGDESRPLRPYLIRNQNIVDEADLIVACPHERFMMIRGGTWSTIRYAKKKNKNLLIIYPNGESFRFSGERPEPKTACLTSFPSAAMAYELLLLLTIYSV